MTSEIYLRKISEYLRESDEIPLFGKAPSFEIKKLSSLLAEALRIPEFSLHFKSQKWVFCKELKKTSFHAISVSPIDFPLYWAMPLGDQAKLTSFLLLGKHKKKAFTSPILQEGYYRFLLLEALRAAQNLAPIQQMTLSLSSADELPEEAALCVDIGIECDGQVMWGSLLIPKSFQQAWVEHFSVFPSPSFGSAAREKIGLELGLRIGSISISYKEWSKLKEGDFLIPDAIARDQKGILCLENVPLFHVEMKDKIQLTDYAFTIEETMETENSLEKKLEVVEQEAKAIQEIPLHVHVELVRFKMTLAEMMKLSPGNFIELPLHAAQAVTLTVNGQKVGTAELVSLGETLGLKLLEI